MGIRVLSPETKFPPMVVQVSGKFDPEEDALPSNGTSVVLQVNKLGGAITVVGTAARETTILVVVAHIPVPLTVTE